MPKDNSQRVKAFLDEIVEVSRRHGLTLSHQDSHGAFVVESFSQRNIEWLKAADDQSQIKQTS